MRKKILVIDDDSDILEILELLLTGKNCSEIRDVDYFMVILYSSLLKISNQISLLLDVMLADMDGRTICKDIKENKLTYLLPVILISGTHDLKHLLHLPGAPNDFIAKPFDIGILLEKLKNN